MKIMTKQQQLTLFDIYDFSPLQLKRWNDTLEYQDHIKEVDENNNIVFWYVYADGTRKKRFIICKDYIQGC